MFDNSHVWIRHCKYTNIFEYKLPIKEFNYILFLTIKENFMKYLYRNRIMISEYIVGKHLTIFRLG